MRAGQCDCVCVRALRLLIYVGAQPRAHTHAHIQAHARTQTCLQTHAHTNTHTHARTHIHKHIHQRPSRGSADTDIHANTHTNTHTNTTIGDHAEGATRNQDCQHSIRLVEARAAMLNHICINHVEWSICRDNRGAAYSGYTCIYVSSLPQGLSSLQKVYVGGCICHVYAIYICIYIYASDTYIHIYMYTYTYLYIHAHVMHIHLSF